MTSERYQGFDTPGIAPGERFEYWRSWYSLAVDAPMQLEPIERVPREFGASAEVLGVGEVDIVELRCGPAVGRWAREATEPSDRLRLALVAPTPGGTGGWHGRELSLARGATAVLGRTDGLWRAPNGMRAIQINVPRLAVPVTDRRHRQDQRPPAAARAIPRSRGWSDPRCSASPATSTPSPTRISPSSRNSGSRS